MSPIRNKAGILSKCGSIPTHRGVPRRRVSWANLVAKSEPAPFIVMKGT